MTTTSTITCDVCGDEIAKLRKIQGSIEEHKPMSLQVIFTTEQTEGRSTDPHLSSQQIDLCDGCKKILLSGKYLFAHGAQGYNKYYFKDTK